MSIEKTTDATVQLIRDNIPEGTVAKSIEEVLREETPEEARLRILNDTQPDKLSDEQKALFTTLRKFQAWISRFWMQCMVFIITQATVLPVMETLPLWADTVLEKRSCRRISSVQSVLT